MKWSTIGRVVMFFGLALAIGFAGVSCMGTESDSQRDVAQMADRADQFLMSLSDEERARATFGFESDERERFHFVPPETFERHGLPLEDMSAEQRERAHDLLRTGLSQGGYMTATEIIELEAILEALEGGEAFSRDPDLYYVSVFGTPSTDGTWAWRFEGHHLSLHFTIVDGGITVSAPTFLAASPAEVMEGPRAGLRPLGSLGGRGPSLARIPGRSTAGCRHHRRGRADKHRRGRAARSRPSLPGGHRRLGPHPDAARSTHGCGRVLHVGDGR